MILTQRSLVIEPWGQGNQGESFLQRSALLRLAVFITILSLLSRGDKVDRDIIVEAEIYPSQV